MVGPVEPVAGQNSLTAKFIHQVEGEANSFMTLCLVRRVEARVEGKWGVTKVLTPSPRSLSSTTTRTGSEPSVGSHHYIKEPSRAANTS